MTLFDCTTDLVGQLNGNGQKGMLQTDAPPVENFWLRHCGENHQCIGLSAAIGVKDTGNHVRH